MADEHETGRLSRRELEARLEEAEATLRAIREGEVDALIVEGPDGPQTFTLQTADQPYRLLVEEMGEGAAILEPDAGVLFANESLAQLIQVPKERLIGGSLRDHVAESSRAALDRLFLSGGGRTESQLVGPGDPIPVAVSMRPLRLEGMDCYCVVVTDLTEPRRLDQAERERATAEAASRAKDRFLSILGHELRNPLGAIRNALEILKRPPDAATDRHMRRIVERQVTQVSALVDDLLDISRIESGKLEVRSAVRDLRPIVASVVEAHRLEADDDGIALEIHGDSEPIFVETDATRLLQVLHNLVSNAMRAIGSSGRIDIHLEQKGSDGFVRVRDDGRGIAGEELDHIFEPFVQGRRSEEASRGGLGLGLTLARRLVEMQGGDLTAESGGVGRGAEFVVRLSSREAPKQRARSSQHPSSPTALRLLIVDDDRDCADSLSILLQGDGHDVHVAYSGSEALETAARSAPEVVISDLGLPGMDGYELARALGPRIAGAQLIAVSGYVDDRAQKLSRDAGFRAHLGKPVDLRKLRRLLRQFGSERPVQADSLESE